MRSVTIVLLFLLVLFNAGCSQKWTDKDRQEFLQGCITKSLKDLGAAKAKAYCDCMLGKIEKKYSNVNDVKYLRSDTSLQRMVNECKQ